MRYSAADFVDADDVARAKSRAPMARQNCRGSMLQVMEIDVAGQHPRPDIECPVCLKTFGDYSTQINRAAVHPILPSHLPDHAGVMEAELRKKSTTTPGGMKRPY